MKGNKISLPKGWIRCRLEDVLSRISNGCSAKQYSEPIDENSLPITRIETISNETINLQKVKYIDSPDEKTIAKYQLHFGDILLSHINSDKHLGKTAYFDLDNETVIHGINLLLLRCSEEIDSKYIIYHLKYLRNIGKFIEEAQRAVNQSSINQKKLKQFDLVLPPLPEQHRIVARLDALLGRVGQVRRRLERVPELLRQFRQSVLARAVSGELTRDWRAADKVWKNVVLQDVCSKIQDGAHHSPKVKYSDPGKDRYMYITSKNIRNNGLELSKVEYVDKYFHDSIYPRCNPEKGDVLLTKDGANTGNVTLNTITEEISLLSSVCLIKPNPDKLSSTFLTYYIQSPTGFQSITGKMTGTAIKRIVLRQIKKAEIPLPPLPEQQEIVCRVESLFAIADRIEERWEQLWANVETLPQAILAKAFRGELVAQDPDDEPASELLARIWKGAR